MNEVVFGRFVQTRVPVNLAADERLTDTSNSHRKYAGWSKEWEGSTLDRHRVR